MSSYLRDPVKIRHIERVDLGRNLSDDEKNTVDGRIRVRYLDGAVDWLDLPELMLFPHEFVHDPSFPDGCRRVSSWSSNLQDENDKSDNSDFYGYIYSNSISNIWNEE